MVIQQQLLLPRRLLLGELFAATNRYGERIVHRTRWKMEWEFKQHGFGSLNVVTKSDTIGRIIRLVE